MVYICTYSTRNWRQTISNPQPESQNLPYWTKVLPFCNNIMVSHFPNNHCLIDKRLYHRQHTHRAEHLVSREQETDKKKDANSWGIIQLQDHKTCKNRSTPQHRIGYGSILPEMQASVNASSRTCQLRYLNVIWGLPRECVNFFLAN